MKIKYLKVKNHYLLNDLNLNFENGDGNISQYILLVGENGLGKSTLLWLIKNTIYMDFQDHSLLGNSTIEICYSFQNEEKNLIAEKLGIQDSIDDTLEVIVSYENNQWEFFIHINNELKFNFTSKEFGRNQYNLRELFKFIYIDDLYGGKVRGNVGDDRFVLLNSFNQQELIEKMKNKDMDNLYHLYINNKDIKGYTSVTQKLTTAINNLFDYKQIEINYKGIVVKKNDLFIPYEYFSAGEKNLVGLAASMIFYQNIAEYAVVLIDEPENSLHPRWQEKILNFIKEITETTSSYNQIIVTTHSPKIIESYHDKNTTTILFEVEKNKLMISSENGLGADEINLRTLSHELTLASKNNSVVILTEGVTDWKHLKAAYTTLLDNKRIAELNIRIYEYNFDMGEAKLEKLLENLAIVPNDVKYIGIFDCDSNIGKKYTTMKKLSENVFAFSLPIPKHRHYHNGICIEFLYTNEDLKKEDSEGRRLYLSSEFLSKSGF